jgi:cytochrome c
MIEKPTSNSCISALAAIIAVAFLPADLAVAAHVPSTGPMAKGHGPKLVMPMMDPANGKKMFVDKGCVACHAINGIGGHDAPALDAHAMKGLMNPFDFAAKMWNHAPAMIAAQEGAFGEQVYFNGDELADIVAFIHNDAAQHKFSERDLTAKARKMMQHEHGAKSAPKAHAKEIGHHKDMPPHGKPGHGH